MSQSQALNKDGPVHVLPYGPKLMESGSVSIKSYLSTTIALFGLRPVSFPDAFRSPTTTAYPRLWAEDSTLGSRTRAEPSLFHVGVLEC